MSDDGDGGGLGDLLAQMGRLQEQFSAAEASVDDVEGSAGGGLVVVRASGEFSFDEVRIDPSVLETGDLQVLEDLVLAAVRDATTKLTALRRNAIGSVVSGALGGLFGSLGAEGSDESEGPASLDAGS